ncbi:hypothetical protein EV701_10925 [Chthoniobacter flavus]|nr:hypothetical protein EV701_10925 [Chthoniobacter flavus]
MPNRPPRVPAVPRSPRPEASPICGLDIAKASGAKVLVRAPKPGEADCFYAWQQGVIVLSQDVALGTDIGSLIAASEEAAHHHQPKWLHALRFLSPARWFAEADAFLRIKRAFGLNC